MNFARNVPHSAEQPFGKETGSVYFCASFLYRVNTTKEMIIVQVKEGELIDRPLKRFKRKFDRTGTMREIRRRTAFTKPSIRRREEILHARYIQQMQDREAQA